MQIMLYYLVFRYTILPFSRVSILRGRIWDIFLYLHLGSGKDTEPVVIISVVDSEDNDENKKEVEYS